MSAFLFGSIVFVLFVIILDQHKITFEPYEARHEEWQTEIC